MRRLAWRGAPLAAAGIAVLFAGVALTGTAASGAVLRASVAVVEPAAGDMGAPASAGGAADQVAPLRRIILPDLLVVSAAGIAPAELARLGRLGHVRDLIAVDGGMIHLAGRPANVLGVDPGAFRSWTPPPTAADARVWLSLADGGLVVSAAEGARLGLTAGRAYPLAGATTWLLRLGAAATLGVPGVDALVNLATAHALGLVPDVAAMISAPGADLAVLTSRVRAVLGRNAQIVDLGAAAGRAPGAAVGQGGRPATYLQLYRQSARLYCPGLSWPILAAIGQIESGNGRDNGPSSAGALGPMQFLPSTWQVWGIPGFGDTTANVMNPYDAVPSAARYLCASGAAAGGASLYQAIYAYNHAAWYVNEVLALAREYASQYG